MEFWIKPEQCSGCGACANACPKNAIEMRWDHQGYSIPTINSDLCVECGLCRKKCPVLKCHNGEAPAAAPKAAQPAIYAAWSRTYETRYNSTSGGVFSELALAMLRQGAYICGAVYDDEQMVRHAVVDSAEGLERIRQSKYTQSETGTVFRDIRQLLQQGKQVLYCGAPCQVAGLYEYLGREPEGLTTVDFICRGINSPMAYRAWLDELEQDYGAKATRVWFKNKERGWNCFSTRVDFANGKHYRKTRYEDLYMRSYLNHNLFIRPSCTDCPFKGLPRGGDLTLADFWKIDKKLDADLGTSMVIVNSKKGQALLDKAAPALVMFPRTYEEALKGNVCLTQSVRHGKYSGAFFQLLKEGRSFSQAFYEATESVPKLSVIVAIDSPTKYLEGSLQSICDQPYAELEVLLVCGSEDPGLIEAVNKAAQVSPRIKLLAPTADLVGALNTGLAAAQGEYIHFCTGREALEEDVYGPLIAEMLDTRSNIACFGWKDPKAVRCGSAFNGTGNAQAFLELVLTASDQSADGGGYGSHLWNKLFRRDAVIPDDTPVCFEARGYAMTELMWLIRVAFNCNRALFTSQVKLRRKVPDQDWPVDSAFASDCPALFEQERQALQQLEGLYPYAFEQLRRCFYDYDLALIAALRKKDLPKTAQVVREHAAHFLSVPIGDEELLELRLQVLELRDLNDRLRADRDNYRKKFISLNKYSSVVRLSKLASKIKRKLGGPYRKVKALAKRLLRRG